MKHSRRFQSREGAAQISLTRGEQLTKTKGLEFHFIVDNNKLF